MSKQLNENNAIPLEWIRYYTDQYLKIIKVHPKSGMDAAILERVNHIYDLVEAYNKRNTPIDKR